MFNKKVATVLCYFVAILLAAEVLLTLVMFVWGMIGNAPSLQAAGRYFSLLQELGTAVFFYLLLTALKYFIAAQPEKVAAKKKVASKN